MQEPAARISVFSLVPCGHEVLSDGPSAMREDYEDVEIVAEASDGQEAVQAVDQLRLGVVVMDINMPKMNGIDATISHL